MALKSTWRKVDELEADKQDALVSGVNIKTVNGNSLLGSGDLPISGGGGISDGDKGDITVSGSGTVWTIDNLAVNNAKINDVAATKVTEDSTHRFVTDSEKTTWNGKQDALVSGTNIKTLEGQSLLGSGNIDLTKSDVGLSNVDNTSDVNKPVSTAQATAIGLKQDTLVSGTNIKTIGGSSILGAGDLPIPDPAGWTTIVKSANQDTLSGTFSDVIDFSFSVVAGGIYMIQIESVYGCASSGTEIAYGFNVTSGNFTGKIQTQRIQSTQTTLTLSEPQAVTTSALLSTMGRNNDISIPHPFTITASITCSANATFKIQHRAGVNNNFVRTFKGSILKYKKIN